MSTAPPRNSFNRLFFSRIIMGSKHLLKPSPSTFPLTPCSRAQQHNLFHNPNKKFLFFSSFPPKLFSNPLCLSIRKVSGVSNVSHASVPRPIPEVYLENPQVNRIDLARLEVLARTMEEFDIDIGGCTPGQYNHLLCPMCKGGTSAEKSLSLFITQDGDSALWMCFQGKCGWKGNMRTFADDREAYDGAEQTSLRLEPLGHKLKAYFAERMISEETLKRNGVMQIFGDQNAIAFSYRKHGVIVGCKYRTIEKRRFWQEKGTEKELYGIDDIKEAAEIIIVDGEMDKLSMEEAGFYNCVSVPSGAPRKVSGKELPPLEKDIAYQYLWNSKDCFDKATRIILATDADLPGQALAEELSRRLGKERCWCVSWPKKDELSCFKDANEVLITKGADTLKEIIANAKMCELHSTN